MQQLRAEAERFWSARNPRERWLLGSGGLLVLVVVPYVAVWEPLTERRDQLQAQVAEQRQDLAWMRSAAEEIHAHDGDNGSAEPVTDERSLLSLVDRAAREAGIDDQLSRVQPDGDGTLRVWMDRVPFDELMNWLDGLQRAAGVEVDALTVERTQEDGLVNVRLTLEVGT
nr:type II secretion system protein M [Halorhodospira halophila]